MHEVRLDGMRQRVHADLIRQPVALARIARRTGSDDVAPIVLATTGNGNDVIARECLAWAQFHHRPTAVLAPIVIPRKQEGVRHLPSKASRHVDELRETNDGRTGHRQTLGTDHPVRFGLDDFRLSINDETKRPTHGDHGQGLERCIQCQTSDDQSCPRRLLTL